MTQVAVFVIGIPLILALLLGVFATEAWLLGIALGIFDVEVTRAQSLAAVILVSLIFGGASASARSS